MPPKYSHVAYSDESYITDSRYRSIAVVSLACEQEEELNEKIASINRESGIKEFKWNKLRQARDRFAAIKLLDLSIEYACDGKLRIDVLVWDTQDSRHSVYGRDDIQNLQRMYYHVYKNILQRRWSRNGRWRLFPDENSTLDWHSMQVFLSMAVTSSKIAENLFKESELFGWLYTEFLVTEISEACSSEALLCQLADLYAGLGVFSRSAFSKYLQWEAKQNQQLVFEAFLDERDQGEPISNRDRERFRIIEYLNELCKRHKLGVAFKSSYGFKTYSPTQPINFWNYDPQRITDKAPTIR